ncbi:MAG: HAMP domain-containing sensor histidine kinase, partial [Candidatus Eiseniibacteriota bacterium]
MSGAEGNRTGQASRRRPARGRLRGSRTLLAALLVLPAIILPCAAWYASGEHAAEEEARRLVADVRMRAYEVAAGLANRLEGHLSALGETEARRPFYHYQSHFHDPTSSCECASVTPSPLTQGPSDPLVLAHFQIDDGGRLTLPTLPVSPIVAATESDWEPLQRAILASLEPLPALLGFDCSTEPPGYQCENWGEGCRAVTLDDDGRVSGRQDGRPGALTLPTSTPRTPTRYQICEFEWHTVPIREQPTLIAVRRVVSPAGRFAQGFVISAEKVDESMQGAAYPAVFLPGEPEIETDALVAIPGAPWRVAINAGEALEAAREQGNAVIGRFRRTFAGVSAASLLAGLCLVGLIGQTERLSHQRQRFAAAAAHELRTPLAGLRLYGDLLADGLGDPAKAGEYASRVSAEAERLGRVVSNVLGYTRLERGGAPGRGSGAVVEAEPGDLGTVVSECVERFRPALEAAGATVTLRVEEDLPPVRFDRDGIFQILQNLLDNAEKYSRDAADRRIEVEVVRGRGGDGGGSGRGSGSNTGRDGRRPAPAIVEIRVADQGPGVPDHLEGHLFDPFTRDEGQDAPPGLGLGLTLVRRIAGDHGGGVEYSGSGGGGATFVVWLPSSSSQ